VGAVSDVPNERSVNVKLSRSERVQTFVVNETVTGGLPQVGAHVVVQAEAGPAFGTIIASAPQLGAKRHPAADFLRVIRLATQEDIANDARHEHREREAYRVGLMKIQERTLGMKLVRVELLFDGSRLVFYFTAEGRVDFRELVRELAFEFHTRIEMRQIGVRDEARMLGGYGTCGRPLCCATVLASFEPVSIKMAKQQDLSLNPSKLSGLCGRLKCCLRFELPNAAGPVHEGCGCEVSGGDQCTGCAVHSRS
jgi:cell fate regulator YaaT (PSP1 superfamily)